MVQICSRRGCKGHVLDLRGERLNAEAEGRNRFRGRAEAVRSGDLSAPGSASETRIDQNGVISMNRLNSVEEFQASPGPACGPTRTPTIPAIVIPAGTCGQASGANDLIRVAKRELLARKLAGSDPASASPDATASARWSPSWSSQPRGTFYPRVQVKEMERIVHAVGAGDVCEELLYVDPETRERIEKKRGHSLFPQAGADPPCPGRAGRSDPHIRLPSRTAATRRWPRSWPKKIPGWVIGRGQGLGPAGPRAGPVSRPGANGSSWPAQPDGRGKILVCNADEGDPGAYMDRSLLEGNPHSIIEGMIIGAFATGATEGIVYVRNEYPLAIKHLIIALRQARELGSPRREHPRHRLLLRPRPDARRRRLRLRRGDRPDPLHRREDGRAPPAPALSGGAGHRRQADGDQQRRDLGERPGHHRSKGPPTFGRTGTAGSPGTKIFSLVGKVRNTGLVEVPMGTYHPARSSTRSAAARGAGRPSRRCRPADPPAAASRRACSTCPSTTTAWPRPGRSWAPAA